MENETKIIEQEFAKIPQNIGDYDELVQQGVTSFGVKERVNRYGCEFESIVENNTYAPMTWDGSETFTEDTTHWRRITGSPEAWIAGQDKPAASEQYPNNGMGRIVLKKNIVNGVNTLTQAMLTQQNTIYVIQYDFTLGEDITVPANCVLEFDGGSLNNGLITFAEYDLKFSGINTVIGARSRISTINNVYDCYIVSPDKISCSVYTPTRMGDIGKKFILCSDKKTPIELDIDTNAECYLISCNILKNTKALSFTNRTDEPSFAIIEDCIVTAPDFDTITEAATVIHAWDGRYSVDVTDPTAEYPRPLIHNITLVCRNSTFNNVGLGAQLNVENCVFNVGKNNLFNEGEVIHLGYNSSIKDCLFYSPDDFVKPSGDLADIIDCFTGENVIISHCEFKNLKCNNIITVKQHFGRGYEPGDHFDPYDNLPANQFNGITISDCTFDCDETDYYIAGFTGTSLSVEANDYRVIAPIRIVNNTFITKDTTCAYFTLVRSIIFSNNTINLKNGYYAARGFIVNDSFHVEFIGNVEFKENQADNESHQFIDSPHCKECIISKNIGRNAYIGISAEADYLYFCDNVSEHPNMLNVNSIPTYDWGKKIEAHGNKAGDYFSGWINDMNSNMWQYINIRYWGAKAYLYPYRSWAAWLGDRWAFDNGFTAALRKGTTAQRPTNDLIADYDAGFPYYDTDLGKMIYLKVEGTVKSWVDATGTPV